MKNKIISIILVIALFFFALTFSIGLPIYVRPFYYMQIEALRLPEISGKTVAEIKGGYDEILDYLLTDAPYGTGVFRTSEAGQSHFADCKVLFNLNTTVLILSGVLLLGYFVAWLMRGKKSYAKLGCYSPSFWSGITMSVAILAIVAFAAIDFDAMFTVFHSVFFPGKTNWIFNPYYDEIILVMPWEFFRNCGILIAASVLIFSAAYIIYGVNTKAKKSELN